MKSKEKKKKAGPTKVKLILAVSATVLCIAIVMLLAATGNLFRETVPQKGVSFLFLPVGQANCALIFTETGTVMIDTGSNASEETLSATLHHYGVESLELLILSHADEDHTGGLDLVLKGLDVSCVMLTEGAYKALDGTYGRDALDEAVAAGSTELCKASAGDTVAVGELTLEVLTPSREDEEIAEGGNEASIVLLVRYGETEAVFPGDIDADGELRALAALEERDAEITCDLLLVGHHGSSTSSSEEFLDALKPDYAVISCGKDNSYGHPTSEVLARLTAVGATVLRTDLEGSILFHSDGTELVRIK